VKNRAVILVSLSLFLLTPWSLWADRSISLEIKRQSQKLHEIEEEIKRHQEKVVTLEKTKESVLQELERLDKEIMETWQRLKDVKREWTEKELELEKIRAEYKKEKNRSKRLKLLVEKRLLALDRFGTMGILNVLFSSTSFPELMARKTYLQVILNRDREQREEFRKRLHSLQEKEEALEKARLDLERLAREMESQAVKLEEKKRDRLLFLKEVKEQKQKYMELVLGLDQAKQTVQGILDELMKEQAAESSPVANEFAAQKGKLNPPVLTGTVLLNNQLGKGGLLISAPMGSEVRAVFDGTVKFTGDISGLGKVVILDHGQGYYSLTAQCFSIFVGPGEKVMEGDVIALSGTGALIDPGVYFELRHRDIRLRPESWLDLKGFQIKR